MIFCDRLLREMPEKRLPAQNGGLSNLWKQSWYAGFDHQVACKQTEADFHECGKF